MKIEAKIFSHLSAISVAYGQSIDTERLKIYTRILSKYEESKVAKAIENCLVKCKFFPSIAEIVEQIDGSEADKKASAVLIANEILNAVFDSKIYHNGRLHYSHVAIMEKIGKEKWELLEEFGGVQAIVNGERSTILAQLRDFVVSKIHRAKNANRSAVELFYEPSKILEYKNPNTTEAHT